MQTQFADEQAVPASPWWDDDRDPPDDQDGGIETSAQDGWSRKVSR